jgi:hypothetical protein
MRRVSETRALVRQDLAEDAAYQREEIEKLLKSTQLSDRDKIAVRMRLYELNLKHTMRPLAAKPIEQAKQEEGPRRIVLNLGDGRTILSQPTPEPDKQSTPDGE